MGSVSLSEILIKNPLTVPETDIYLWLCKAELNVCQLCSLQTIF